MENTPSVQELIQNLKDAGCDCKTVEKFLLLEEHKNTQGQMKLLSMQREVLLKKVHQQEKKICCLDYLVYQLSRKIELK